MKLLSPSPTAVGLSRRGSNFLGAFDKFSDSKSQGSHGVNLRRVNPDRADIITEENPGDDSDRVPDDEDGNTKAKPRKPPQTSTVSANRHSLKKRKN